MKIKNNESGINREDYRNCETVNRVNTTGTALLGLTLGCAQCHSHKYDPILQKEYYWFMRFLTMPANRTLTLQDLRRIRFVTNVQSRLRRPQTAARGS